MFTKRFLNLTPYTPGEQPREMKYIKLNTNENPFPPSDRVIDFLKNVDPEKLRLYPDPASLNLRKAIAAYYGLKAENIFAGNGSDEVLSFCFYAFFESGRGPLLFPVHTYSFYPVYCSYYGIEFERIPLNEDFSVNPDLYLQKHNYTGIIIPNPNAPTGMALTSKELDRFLSGIRKDSVVVIDEAYIDFGGETAVPLLEKYKNLLVVQTFSKSRSLAGSRIGFAMGDRKLIDALATVKDSFNSYPLDYPAQETGRIAIEDRDYFNRTVNEIIETREWLSRSLEDLGWEVLPSKANFIFTRKRGIPGGKVYSQLKEKGVLVRHFNNEGIEDFIRVTIGKRDDMEVFLDLVENFQSS